MVSPLLLTLLPFLLISVSDSSPFKRSTEKRLVAECLNHGYISHSKCVCLKGTFGNKCEHVETMMCEDGVCPYDWMYCNWLNEDCRQTDRCLDKRGWCLPHVHPPNARLTEEEELYLTP